MIKEFDLLKKIYSSTSCPHAFLFVGPSGIGKFETAIIFAEFLMDSKINNHPDVYIVKKEDDKKEIVDAQIIDKNKKEGLIYKINNSPISGKYNIVIIKDADLMNKTVSNTILKSLEEPRDNTFFILTTSNKKNILETIISRCLVLDFSLINKEEAFNIIGNNSKRELIYDFSSGKYNKILELMDSDLLDKYISDIKDFANILKSKDFEKILYINKIFDEKLDINYYIYIWELYFNFVSLNKYVNLFNENKLLNIGESIKKLYNIKNAIKGNYILKVGLINFLLEIR